MILIVLVIAATLLNTLRTQEDETYLENFDKRILQEIKYPIASNGEYLYQNMLRYYSDLLDMLNMIKTENVKVKRYVRGLIESGGPKIFQHSFDTKKLETVYNWTKSETDVFKSAFVEAKLLWGKIQNTTFSEEKNDSDEDYSYSDDSEKDDYEWTETKQRS